MSETVIENVEEVAVKKESTYKTDIFILKILAFVAMSIIFAALTDFSLSILFVIDFIFIFAACVYGRMISHTPSKSSDFIDRMANAGTLGYDSFGFPTAGRRD